jgi:hypothetical protein
VLRCPLAPTANGQQHSTSCFVCNPQCNGLVQGGALAPETGGLARARSLPLSPGRSASPLWALSTYVRAAPRTPSTCVPAHTFGCAQEPPLSSRWPLLIGTGYNCRVVRFGRAQSCRSWANRNMGSASGARFCAACSAGRGPWRGWAWT